MDRLPHLHVQGVRKESIDDLAFILDALHREALGDQLAEADALVVGGVVGLSLQELPELADLRVLLEQLAQDRRLVVDPLDVEFHLPVHLVELSVELLTVRGQQVVPHGFLARHHDAEAHRQDDSSRQRILQDARVGEQLLTPRLQRLVGNIAGQGSHAIARHDPDRTFR